MPAASPKTSVFSHSGTAVAAVSVLAVVTFAAVEAITGSAAAEEEAVGTAAVVKGGTGDAGAAALAAASRFAARTLLRCLSLGPR